MRVQVGIDAVITANNHVCVRQVGPDDAVTTRQFLAPPPLVGLSVLSGRRSGYPSVLAVAEPTSMILLPLAASLDRGPHVTAEGV